MPRGGAQFAGPKEAIKSSAEGGPQHTFVIESESGGHVQCRFEAAEDVNGEGEAWLSGGALCAFNAL